MDSQVWCNGVVVLVRSGMALVWTDAPGSFDYGSTEDSGMRASSVTADAISWERLVVIPSGDVWAQVHRYMSGTYRVRDHRSAADVLPSNADIYLCAQAHV